MKVYHNWLEIDEQQHEALETIEFVEERSRIDSDPKELEEIDRSREYNIPQTLSSIGKFGDFAFQTNLKSKKTESKKSINISNYNEIRKGNQ